MNDIEEVLNMIAEAVKEAEKQKNKAAKDKIFKRTLLDQIQQELDAVNEELNAVNEELKKEEEQKEEAPVIGPLPFHEILKCVLLNAKVTGKEMAFWRESKPEEVFYISYVRGKPYSIISGNYSPMLFESSALLADDWYASEDPGED